MYKCCLDIETISRIRSMPKGSRPDPETYMTKEQIEEHLKQFVHGGSFVMTRRQYEQYIEGRKTIGYRKDNSQYMTSKTYMDNIENNAKNALSPLSVYEKALGFELNYFYNGGGIVRIDVYTPRNHNARIPSGNEEGANPFFVPGGYTAGGAPECVTDVIPNDDAYRKVYENYRR